MTGSGWRRRKPTASPGFGGRRSVASGCEYWAGSTRFTRSKSGHVTSGYWWLGLYRVAPPGFGPSPLALQAQALGEGVLAPWGWFLNRVIDWDGSPEVSDWHGRVAATGHEVQLQLDSAGRPATLDLLDSSSCERVRVEYFGWRWLDRTLLPERLRLIENAGSVNEFVRLEMRLAPPVRAPASDS
jgi:hypothetical protein